MHSGLMAVQRIGSSSGLVELGAVQAVQAAKIFQRRRAAAAAAAAATHSGAASSRRKQVSGAVALLLLALWQALRQLAFTAVSLVHAVVAARLRQIVLRGRTPKAATSPTTPRATAALPPPPKPTPEAAAAAAAQAAAVAAARPPPALPPRCPNAPRRLTVVLDLDETLLSSVRLAGLPAERRGACLAAGAATVHYGRAGDDASTLLVFPRPGAREFLAAAASFAELVLFSAASAAYAAPLADLLDPSRDLFAARLYREATVSVGARGGVKDLSKLGRDLGSVVLVDNCPYSFLLHPCNGVPVLPYYGPRGAGTPAHDGRRERQARSSSGSDGGGADSAPADGDAQLLSVILPLLQSLAEVCGAGAASADVRPILRARFGMPAWFRGKGLPVPRDEDDEAFEGSGDDVCPPRD